MKRKRHSPEQTIAKLREADGMLAAGSTIAQICQRLELSEQTFHRWRNQYGGTRPAAPPGVLGTRRSAASSPARRAAARGCSDR